MNIKILFIAACPRDPWMVRIRRATAGLWGHGQWWSLLLVFGFFHPLFSAPATIEWVQACLIPPKSSLTPAARLQIAECLEWQADENNALCQGNYALEQLTPLPAEQMVQVDANEVSFYPSGQSVLRGNVILKKQDMQLQANTAYVYRDSKSKAITQINLLDGVRYVSPSGLMLASKASYQPLLKTMQIEEVLYRLDAKQREALLSGWGRAHFVEKNKLNQLLMQQATYTTCSPNDNSWEVRAQDLKLDRKHNVGVAKNASVRIHDVPVLYTPYLTFPLSKRRKSGFLIPTMGTTTIGGFDMTTPYYLNLAPNYDATLIPHLYTKRGVMYGGQFRYLTHSSTGRFIGNILPQDNAYRSFINNHVNQYPFLANNSTNRWDLQWLDDRTIFDPALRLHIDARQYSDDYYLQDFSTNLGTVTERQILRQAVLEYNTANWVVDAAVQSYQTLQPINDTPVADIYERLPQLIARGQYNELPLDTQLDLDSEFDYFRWPNPVLTNPEGSRYHFSPRLAMDKRNSWGYLTPAVQWVGNAYSLSQIPSTPTKQQYLSVPRFSVDSGLTFERSTSYFNHPFMQTLEPRLYYLNVPYQDQSQIPVFDSGYMIFTSEQVFRDNRFSGFDRIGDANQLAYGATTRWISEQTGEERASLTLAQIRYFADRKVGICYNPLGPCVDNPLTLGLLSPVQPFSPLTTRGVYHFNSLWSLVGDYAWDPATNGTYNGQVSFGYRAENNRLLNVGYSYLVNGDVTQVATSKVQDDALNQISVSYAWPFSDRWSSLGAYSYNVSKQYQMMTLLGVQYESCCWAVRLIGGRTFRSLDPLTFPQYTNSVFLQVLLKGLGSVGNSDPTSVLRTFLPGYRDSFRN